MSIPRGKARRDFVRDSCGSPVAFVQVACTLVLAFLVLGKSSRE